MNISLLRVSFNEPVNTTFMEYSKKLINDSIPELRTTVQWFQQIDIAVDNDRSITEFYTSDICGDFIILKVVTVDGRIIRRVSKFSVE